MATPVLRRLRHFASASFTTLALLAAMPAWADDDKAATADDETAAAADDETAAAADDTATAADDADKPTGTDATTQDQTIYVYGRGETRIGTAGAASEGGVAGRDLDVRPLLRPGEILEATPGLIATQHSGGGKANQYFLRGFNLDHGTDFTAYVDDMPWNLRTHGHGQGYLDVNGLIPEVVSIPVVQNPTFVTSPRPKDGSSPSHTAKMRMRKMPMRKLGSETPTSEVVSMAREIHESRRSAV